MFVLWALPLGIAIGAISGFFGVGGGFLLTPILLLLGYSPATAITISLLYSMSTSISGALTYIKKKRVLWTQTLILSISGMISTQLAQPLVIAMERSGIDNTIIPLFYVILLSYFSLSMLSKDTSVGEMNTTSSYSPVLTVLIGLAGGFISSVLGVGGGFVMVPLLIRVLRMPPRLAIGTSLATIFVIVTTGFLTYIGNVEIPLSIALTLVIGAVIGSRFGANLTDLFSESLIKKMLGTLYLFTLTSIILKLLHQPLIGLIIVGAYVLALMILFTYQYRTKKKRLFQLE
ncbi:sulfite exporter TauE/SafE family protein [Bacillus sp. NTK071]|uniref:sulfite exporter TauE/SafE family protein n=1 Tax=Bacillus sp. NTK071 TaxID=2802175 RepID=UPI001A8D7B88|nr:sulfite exporter TauE/SafE family protein [Bacillus sp. NTK071]MBN8210012.1 sulfite exporter TauE/SafE family protein [Bacillus sp. NTK071]